ncbi:hypothetical protein PF008_g17394 [Phytophthora fragariae]|uniref:CCHC-type domain-containing protein n=1 Tax=Phytophthora fragariae TaxID=53985 RepID=A0A6G0R8D9_9STRA|nr:hypothetical protein PF008_g17394 [Phytophthora fragariae]
MMVAPAQTVATGAMQQQPPAPPGNEQPVSDAVASAPRQPGQRGDGGRSGRHRIAGGGPPPSDGSGSSSDSSSDEKWRPRGGRRRVESSSESESSDDSEDSFEYGSSGSESSDEDSSDDSDGRRGHGRRGRHGRRRRERHREHGRRRHERRSRRKNVKDLELPTFTPSPKVSVSTWINRVDLALKGAEESGRGKWSDKALYFILGNKLMENAAKWWVDMDRRTTERKSTWTKLKRALLRRYGEKLDKSAAEWRVSMRRMMPGETHADFAAGLRGVVGRNKVSERVLLAQFYRCLDKTTKKLVKQHPKPRTLEEAVDKATEIDDPMDNVAQGMINIGQAWATTPSRYVIPMSGTMGHTNVIPGISGAGLPAEMVGSGGDAMMQSEVEQVALFTNPQGVYNAYSGTWDPPPGHVWNGKYRNEPRKVAKKSSVAASGHAESKKSAGKAMATMSSGEESEPRRKKVKAAVKQAGANEGRGNSRPADERRRVVSGNGASSGVQASGTTCYLCGKSGHWAQQCSTGPKCYACNQNGHYARNCTNEEAKAKNDAYLQTRGTVMVSENNERAT